MWRNAKLRLAILVFCGAAIAVPTVTFAATNVQTIICSPFDAPSITAPASGTSTTDTSTHVVGRGEPGMVVRVFKDGLGSGATTAGVDGSYAISVPLDTGDNTLIANESNSCDTVKTSTAVRVTRALPAEQPEAPAPLPVKPVEITKLTTADPVLVATPTAATDASVSATPANDTAEEHLTPAQKQMIATPQPNEEISSDRTWVTGKTTPVTKVDIYVNKTIAASVVSDTVGIYGALVNMKPGKNTIQVQATASDGTVITVRTIDVQLVKKETNISKEDKTVLKNAQDTVGLIIIAAIGLGGALIILTILWHTYHLRKGNKKHHA